MRGNMRDVEIIGLLRNWTKKHFTKVSITQKITAGEELAEAGIDGTKTKIYMPGVKVNGVGQSIADNELDLDVASNLITEEQWSSISEILS